MAIRQPDYIIIGGGQTSGSAAQTLIVEKPQGSLDGSNRVFTLSFSPSACAGLPPAFAIWLILNGNLQSLYFPAGAPQYTLAGNVVTFAVAPVSTDWLEVKYFIGPGAVSVPGRARLFSLNTDMVDWGHTDLYSIIGDLSLGIWIKLSSNAQGSIIGYAYNSTGLDTPYYLQVAGSSGAWSIRYVHDYGSGSTAEDHTFATALANDTWYYIGISRDATAKTVKLYKGTGSSAALFDTFSYTNNPGGSSANSRMMIGNINGGSGGSVASAPLIGTTQQYYVWSAALSVTDHTNAMNGQAILTNMVLGCVSGNTPEIDSSGNGGVGNVTGTTLVQGH